MPNESFLFNAVQHMRDAAGVCEINLAIVKALEKPDKVLFATLKFFDGKKTVTVPAWRIQHNNARGPYKGGIRFHDTVGEQEVTALATEMTLKTALYGLPLGGGKGGVTVNPKLLNPRALERLSRTYVRAFYKHIGAQKDIPAPDVNTNSQIMAWMMDEYGALVGHDEPGVVTGKPIEVGGSQLREEATSLGGYFVLQEALRLFRWKKKPSRTTVAIQGFGNVGKNVAKILYREGYRIVAISDSSGAVRAMQGKKLNPFEIERGIQKGVVSACYLPGVRSKECGIPFDRDDLLFEKVDILIPAASENQIRKDNVDTIRAKLVLELANGPMTREAQKVLFKKGIRVVPDILANGGGVVVSYFEWVQNLNRWYWSRKEVEERLRSAVRQTCGNVFKVFRAQRGISLRTAAYGVALRNIERAMQLRGRP